jgi:flagellar biosynthesis protein
MTQYKDDKQKIAVALEYDKNKTTAPKVVASGYNNIAEKIIEIAKQNGIHIHSDANLAKILSIVELNSYIPYEVYSVVADILSYIYTKDDEIAKRKNKEKNK